MCEKIWQVVSNKKMTLKVLVRLCTHHSLTKLLGIAGHTHGTEQCFFWLHSNEREQAKQNSLKRAISNTGRHELCRKWVHFSCEKRPSKKQ